MQHQTIEKTNSVLLLLEKDTISIRFPHLEKGNWNTTLVAIADYLADVGVRRQSHIADLIMQLEKHFKGKYLKGRATHYQHIMPVDGIRQGDSLSEKIPKCKDRNTFRQKFEVVGKTELITDAHLMGKIDFQNMLYLRVLDTQDNYKSWFFRNDKGVSLFIEDALKYAKLKKDQGTKRRKKARQTMGEYVASGGTFAQENHAHSAQENHAHSTEKTMHTMQTKPCALDKENHAHFLGYYIGVHKRTEKNKNTHSEKREREEKVVNSNSVNILGLSTEVNDSDLNSISINANEEGNSPMIEKTPWTPKTKSTSKGSTSTTASEVLANLTQQSKTPSTLSKAVDKAMSKSLSKAEGGKKNQFSKDLWFIYVDALKEGFPNIMLQQPMPNDLLKLQMTFDSFIMNFPAEEFPQFLLTVMQNAGLVKNYLKQKTTFTKFHDEMPTYLLAQHASVIFTWYSAFKLKHKPVKKAVSILNTATQPLENQDKPPNVSLQMEGNSVKDYKFVNLSEGNAVGYTYMGGKKYMTPTKLSRTYEEQVAEAHFYKMDFEYNDYLAALKKEAIDFEASMVRVKSLIAVLEG